MLVHWLEFLLKPKSNHFPPSSEPEMSWGRAYILLCLVWLCCVLFLDHLCFSHIHLLNSDPSSTWSQSQPPLSRFLWTGSCLPWTFMTLSASRGHFLFGLCIGISFTFPPEETYMQLVSQQWSKVCWFKTLLFHSSLGWIILPLATKRYVQILTSDAGIVNVTLFGKGGFAHISKLRWDHGGVGWAPL